MLVVGIEALGPGLRQVELDATVRSGADTMKMISSTSITSTIGVTLISAITALRRLRRPPPPDELATFIAMYRVLTLRSTLYRPSRPLVDLTRQDG